MCGSEEGSNVNFNGFPIIVFLLFRVYTTQSRWPSLDKNASQVSLWGQDISMLLQYGGCKKGGSWRHSSINGTYYMNLEMLVLGEGLSIAMKKVDNDCPGSKNPPPLLSIPSNYTAEESICLPVCKMSLFRWAWKRRYAKHHRSSYLHSMGFMMRLAQFIQEETIWYSPVP